MFPLNAAPSYFEKRLKDYIQFSIFLAGGEGFYYSSQIENSQETKYINFRVTKWIENSKYLFWKKIRFQWQKECNFFLEMLRKKNFLSKQSRALIKSKLKHWQVLHPTSSSDWDSPDVHLMFTWPPDHYLSLFRP